MLQQRVKIQRVRVDGRRTEDVGQRTHNSEATHIPRHYVYVLCVCVCTRAPVRHVPFYCGWRGKRGSYGGIILGLGTSYPQGNHTTGGRKGHGWD